MLPDSLYPRASGKDMTPRVTMVSFMAPGGKAVDAVARNFPDHFLVYRNGIPICSKGSSGSPNQTVD